MDLFSPAVNHKSLDEFEFQPDPIADYGLSCPWASEKAMYNDVTTLAPSFLIISSSFLQVKSIVIKYWMVLKFGKIGPGVVELAALEYLKKSHRLIMEETL